MNPASFRILTQILFLTPAFIALTPFAVPLSHAAIPTDGFYQVVRGDTLSQIAERQYGNWVKYKDLWKRNEDLVNNPNLILPGQRLRLLTQEEVKFFESQNEYASSSETPSAAEYRYKKGRSKEWMLLPKQEWENFVFKKEPEMEFSGFDRKGRIGKKVNDQTTIPAIIAEDRLPIQGEITNARSEFSQIFLGDTVFVRADEQIQMGTIYSITSGPNKVESHLDGRVGFTYEIMGRIRIIGVRDGLFIATVIDLRAPIERHQLLIPEVKSISFPTPIANLKAVTASVIFTGISSATMMSEQQIVFLDQGTDDGLTTGAILRHYLKKDPQTEEEITSKDFLIQSELLVIRAGKRFSTALILKGRGSIKDGDEAVALTDLTDFNRNLGIQTLIQDASTRSGPDELDTLDQTDGLGEKEDHELHQLENWNKQESSTPPQPAPTSDNSSSLNPALDEEIKREKIHPDQKNITDVGNEPAPNDGSDKAIKGKKPETATPPSNTTPEETNAAASEAPPSATELTSPVPESLPVEVIPATPTPTPQVESSGPEQTVPPPVKE